MHKKPIFCCLVWLFTGTSAFSLDPIQDFLQRNSDADGQLFDGEEWIVSNQPPGGYLLRFTTPTGLNGTDLTFVSTSLRISSRESEWSVYSTNSKGNSVFLSDNSGFSSRNFYVAPPSGGHAPVLSEITSDKTAILVHACWIDNAGKWHETFIASIPRNLQKEFDDPSFSSREIQELVLANSLGIKFVPRVEIILLKEHLQDAASKWRVCRDNNIYGLQAQPGQETHITGIKEFSRNMATAMWKRDLMKIEVCPGTGSKVLSGT